MDGRPLLFDAIEFDPVIATADVLYDLAFTLMDFLHYGRVRPRMGCSTATLAPHPTIIPTRSQHCRC